MTGYALAYRLGLTPWEGYRTVAARSIADRLDREVGERRPPLGRALDLGCGRGGYTRWLADYGWEAVGVDVVPQAVEEARAAAVPGSSFVVADVTDLPASLGRFDFFLDVGCLQGLSASARSSVGRGITGLANPGATLLVLAFGPTVLHRLVGGLGREDVASALPGWTVLAEEAADTTGLGWPMSRTAPRWYRLRLTDDPPPSTN